MIEMRERVRQVIPGTAEPGWRELCDALSDLVVDLREDGPPIELQRLKRRVYRLTIEDNGASRSFVLKRFDPWLARRNELVLRRWLPALGMEGRAPRLLTTAAERRGEWIWHVYEDLGDAALDATQPDPQQVAAVVEVIAELHTRASGHTLLPACRHFCGDLGAAFFAANLRDAIAVLEAVSPPRVDPTPEQGELRGRLLGRLYRLREELPRRVRDLEDHGGPETMLHGDLWTTNAIVAATGAGGGGEAALTARLIDWDHAAVGPVGYDLSTFLYRFAAPQRPWILDLYRRAVEPAGWRLPSAQALDRLFETAEYARYANRIIWPAAAVLEERAAWGFDQLAEVERWFDTFELALAAA